MTNPLPKTDVVIVGLGAAGGIASYVLARAGLNVVGLEAGPRLSTKDFVPHLDEIANGVRNWMGEFKFNKEMPTVRPDTKTAAVPGSGTRMMNAVGGTSIHYGTQSWRFRADDFKVHSETVAKYGAGAIPPGATTTDWPLGYDDLEPYYDQVEYLIGVSGKAGNIAGVTQDGGNPFESARAREYPLPPLRSFGYGELISEPLTSLGYHPFPQPSAVLSEQYGDRPACTYCGFCGNYGCWNDSKSSTLVSAIAEAEKTGKLEIRPNSRVMTILSNDKGQVTGVSYLDESGELQEQPAGLVIVSTYVYENVRLLLLSTSPYFKQGLANNNGQLGKHYISHAYVGVNAVFSGKALNMYSGTNGQAIAFDDLNGDHFDHTGLGFIRGAVVFASNGQQPIGTSRSLPATAPRWGSAYKQWLHQNANSIGGLFAQVESQPLETNFLDLDPDSTDALGVPRIRVTYSLGENDIKATQYLDAKMREILAAAGGTDLWNTLPPGVGLPINSHAYGGTRMGDDPVTSVVNKYGLAHEAPNLAVLGGSVFPGSSGYNPTETIEAHAWYAAEYIAKNFQSIAV